ncbi:hypothetical protein AAC389_19930 [Rhodococcus qingshengii]|uniref:hypothetical protein n=1 Tax=Rhodococcus qingshengii TaxID=334542 RepID=UPI00311CA2AF
MQFPSCAVVPFTTPSGTGRAILTSEGVTVIESPPGTLTDRGVGDGSPWLKSNRPTATIIRHGRFRLSQANRSSSPPVIRGKSVMATPEG